MINEIVEGGKQIWYSELGKAKDSERKPEKGIQTFSPWRAKCQNPASTTVQPGSLKALVSLSFVGVLKLNKQLWKGTLVSQALT